MYDVTLSFDYDDIENAVFMLEAVYLQKRDSQHQTEDTATKFEDSWPKGVVEWWKDEALRLKGEADKALKAYDAIRSILVACQDNDNFGVVITNNVNRIDDAPAPSRSG